MCRCVSVLLQTNIMDNGVLGDCKDTAKNLVSPHNLQICQSCAHHVDLNV
jgi:hypothetical protein